MANDTTFVALRCISQQGTSITVWVRPRAVQAVTEIPPNPAVKPEAKSEIVLHGVILRSALARHEIMELLDMSQQIDRDLEPTVEAVGVVPELRELVDALREALKREAEREMRGFNKKLAAARDASTKVPPVKHTPIRKRSRR